MDIKMKFLSLTFFVSMFCLVQISAQNETAVSKKSVKTIESPANTVVVINNGEVEVYKWNGEMPAELSEISKKYDLADVFAETSVMSDMHGHMEMVDEEVVTNADGTTVVKKTKTVVKKDGKECSEACAKACEANGKTMKKDVQSDVQVKEMSKDCSKSCSDKSTSSSDKGVKSDVQVKKASGSCCKKD